MISPPLSLYIHIPWCVRKCPYCDFNSHQQDGPIPAEAYVDALLDDLHHDLAYAQDRPIHSIFFGGGTPSLMPANALQRLMQSLRETLTFSHDCEVSLEVNPGTSEYSDFDALLATGINRLSFGAQSFNDLQLQKLGRIHSSTEISKAVNKAKSAAFSNFNIDLMHSLPGQTVSEALDDLHQAIALSPTHISWYQLTIETNTAFYNNPPSLPSDDSSAEIYEAGIQLLAREGYLQYETSAYARTGQQAKHNLNYWRFGDYLAIGAGAHGKITNHDTILRYHKTRTPTDYLNRQGSRTASSQTIKNNELAVEFMMNALRLNDGVDSDLFNQRTGLELLSIEPTLQKLRQQGLLEDAQQRLQCTELGRRWLNDILNEFMQD